MTIPLYDSNDESPGSPRGTRLAVSCMVGAAAIVALIGAMGGTASADPGVTSPGTTSGNVEVGTSIALTGLTANFTLTGIPGATATGLSAVTMVVTTNNVAGYAVTVESASPVLVGAVPGNTDTIPVADVGVRETGGSTFASLSAAAAVTVHSQDGRSAEIGDIVSNDYQVAIPFVSPDTYTTTLNYIATTL